MMIGVKALETIVLNSIAVAQGWRKLTDDEAIHEFVIADPTIRELCSNQAARVALARNYVRCVADALREGDHRRLRRLRHQLGPATYDKIIAMLEVECG